MISNSALAIRNDSESGTRATDACPIRESSNELLTWSIAIAVECLANSLFREAPDTAFVFKPRAYVTFTHTRASERVDGDNAAIQRSAELAEHMSGGI